MQILWNTILYNWNACRVILQDMTDCLDLKKKCVSTTVACKFFCTMLKSVTMYLNLLSIKHPHLPKLYFDFTSITSTNHRFLLLFVSWFSTMKPSLKLPVEELQVSRTELHDVWDTGGCSVLPWSGDSLRWPSFLCVLCSDLYLTTL